MSDEPLLDPEEEHLVEVECAPVALAARRYSAAARSSEASTSISEDE